MNWQTKIRLVYTKILCGTYHKEDAGNPWFFQTVLMTQQWAVGSAPFIRSLVHRVQTTVALRNFTLCSIFVLFIFEFAKTYKIIRFSSMCCVLTIEVAKFWRLTSPLPSGRSDISAATLENYILVFGDSEKYPLYQYRYWIFHFIIKWRRILVFIIYI